MWTSPERRQRRSQESHQALHYQLAHSRDRGGLDAVVLANEDGLVVASAGDDAVCEELGAMAPLMSRAIFRAPLPPLLEDGDVAVRTLRMHGQSLYLAALGGGVAREALLKHSLTGVERILCAN